MSLTIIQKSCMNNCLSFQTNVSHLFESHTGNRVKPRDEFHALTGKFWKEGWGYKQSCSSSVLQSCHENSPVQTERLKCLQIHPLCENFGSLWQKKPLQIQRKSCYFASLSKKAMILGMKAILFLQNHFRKMMAKFREFGITRSIMLLIFINPKDKLSKGIF